MIGLELLYECDCTYMGDRKRDMITKQNKLIYSIMENVLIDIMMIC